MNTTAAPDPQLSLFEPPRLPVDPDARALVDYLDRAFTWRTRAQILRDLGFDDRRLRAAREASNFQVISGQNGFRHMRHATPDERESCPYFFESQGKDMMAKASGYRRAIASWNFFDAAKRQPEPTHA